MLALAMGAAALAPTQPQVAGKVAAKAAGAAALGAAMTLSSVPAFAAAGDSIRRTEPVARKEAADESSTVQLKYSYTNMPWEDLETSTAKFAPKTNWNTLYPEKRLRLEKKSPVARKDLAPAGNFETYAKTYPGLYSALSGLPMGETTPFLGAKPAEPPAELVPGGQGSQLALSTFPSKVLSNKSPSITIPLSSPQLWFTHGASCVTWSLVNGLTHRAQVSLKKPEPAGQTSQ